MLVYRNFIQACIPVFHTYKCLTRVKGKPPVTPLSTDLKTLFWMMFGTRPLWFLKVSCFEMIFCTAEPLSRSYLEAQSWPVQAGLAKVAREECLNLWLDSCVLNALPSGATHPAVVLWPCCLNGPISEFPVCPWALDHKPLSMLFSTATQEHGFACPALTLGPSVHI